MKIIQFAYLLLTLAATAEEFKVEFSPLPDWQQPILAKVTFDVQIRSLPDIIRTESMEAKQPQFLVFTAATNESLGKRLLWIDAEVELSDGRIREYKGISFHLLSKGLEADIQKLQGVDSITKLKLTGEEESDPKPVTVTRLKILSATFK